ncbi:unnamed protein product [Rangifer tarandus platyrhynchus]|uniref:Uncharacterized protein n=1 Tax=Rangifer tarandus platyrhynchus TaxID=3082113 RepID=A0AC59ZMC9_RANTA
MTWLSASGIKGAISIYKSDERARGQPRRTDTHAIKSDTPGCEVVPGKGLALQGFRQPGTPVLGQSFSSEPLCQPGVPVTLSPHSAFPEGSAALSWELVQVLLPPLPQKAPASTLASGLAPPAAVGRRPFQASRRAFSTHTASPCSSPRAPAAGETPSQVPGRKGEPESSRLHAAQPEGVFEAGSRPGAPGSPPQPSLLRSPPTTRQETSQREWAHVQAAAAPWREIVLPID